MIKIDYFQPSRAAEHDETCTTITILLLAVYMALFIILLYILVLPQFMNGEI